MLQEDAKIVREHATRSGWWNSDKLVRSPLAGELNDAILEVIEIPVLARSMRGKGQKPYVISGGHPPRGRAFFVTAILCRGRWSDVFVHISPGAVVHEIWAPPMPFASGNSDLGFGRGTTIFVWEPHGCDPLRRVIRSPSNDHVFAIPLMSSGWPRSNITPFRS